MKSDSIQLLRSATSILLVDWPNPGVPRALLAAGFTVYGFSPGGYSIAQIVPDKPADRNSFSPCNSGEEGYLIFQKTENSPQGVDIINIYRPEEEHAAIIEKHALPLTAKAVWLHPPVTSALTRIIAAENGLAFIEGVNIVDAANTMKK